MPVEMRRCTFPQAFSITSTCDLDVYTVPYALFLLAVKVLLGGFGAVPGV